MEKGVVLPLFYLPPIAFFKQLIDNKDKTIIIEKHEHFPKQTYRNRAAVYGPNGKLNLIVPVLKGSKMHTSVKDVKISYDADWQRLHWLSLQTSYRSSAYFEFYEDDFAPFYEKRFEYLFDFNLELLNVLNKHLKLNFNFEFSQSYKTNYEEDFRALIHPKKESNYKPVKYFQVFEDKYNFMPNLSVVDLLFNQGPQSAKFI